MTAHVVLPARSVTGQHDVDEVRRLAVTLAAHRGAPVHAAFLEGAGPSLHETLTACSRDGAARVVVVPAHVPSDRGLLLWGARAIAHWRTSASTDGATVPEIHVSASPATQEGLIDALAAVAEGASSSPTATPSAFTSPEWSTVPDPRHHVLVCQGPRCTARGATAVGRALTARLRERRQHDTEVLVTRTACLFPCNLGPVVRVNPSGAWYGALDADGARRIVDEHLVEGRPVEGLLAGVADRTIGGEAPTGDQTLNS